MEYIRLFLLLTIIGIQIRDFDLVSRVLVTVGVLLVIFAIAAIMDIHNKK